MVPLGEVARQRKAFVDIDDGQVYTRCRVQLAARGVVCRDRTAGSDIKTKRQQICNSGDFVVAEIDAKLGGYGIIPDELNGAIVSSHYFLFDISEDCVDLGFFRWYLKTPQFFSQIAARGSTNYSAVRPSKVLEYVIPLPPLDTQRRIVARLDAVAEKVERTQKRYADEAEQIWGLCRSIIRSTSERGGSIEPAANLMVRRASDVTVEPEATYEFAGVYSFGRGVFPGDRKRGADFSYTQLTRLREGDFVYPKLMAWEGALGVVPPECDGRVVSPEFPVFEIDRAQISPAIVDIFFRDPATWHALRDGSKGTNLRRRRINPDQFLMLKVPVPSRADRLLLDEIIPKAKKATELIAKASSELEHLLPSLLHRAFG